MTTPIYPNYLKDDEDVQDRLCGDVSSRSQTLGFKITCTHQRGHNGDHGCKPPEGYAESWWSWRPYVKDNSLNVYAPESEWEA